VPAQKSRSVVRLRAEVISLCARVIEYVSWGCPRNMAATRKKKVDITALQLEQSEANHMANHKYTT
jgi:hypothetical protein